MFCSKLPQFWNKSANGMLTTTFCIFYLPWQSWSTWIGRLSIRRRMALVLQAHLSSSQKKQNGEKICQSHAGEKEKGRQRLTDRDAEGDRQRQRSAWIVGRPCQSHRAEGTRDLIGSDRGWFILLIRGIIKYTVLFSFCFLWVLAWRVSSACLPVLDHLSF